jgi:hypothetical protein
MGNYVNAAYYLTEFCHAYPGHEMYAAALFWVAESFFAREQYDEARALYERIVQDFPQDAKRPDAQSRIETIRWFRRTESPLSTSARPQPVTPPEVAISSGPELPYPGTKPEITPHPTANFSSTDIAALDRQREFVNSLLTLSAQINKDKKVADDRLAIVTALIARNTADAPPIQWNPEQQVYIADLLARNATQTNGLNHYAPPSDLTDQVERLLAELLTKNAEFTYRHAPLAEREKYIADLNTLNARLKDEKSRIDGQQRVIAELIGSSMGLTSGIAPSADQRGVIDNRLNTLDQQIHSGGNAAAPATVDEKAELLKKVQSLWRWIETEEGSRRF